MSHAPPEASRAVTEGASRLAVLQDASRLVVLQDALSVLAMDPDERDAPALITDRFTWTFAEVAHRTLALARRLHARGLARGGRAALRATGTPEVFLAIHALASLGVTIVPIHPRLSAPEVRVLLDVTRPTHVLEEEDLTLDPDTSAAQHAPVAGALEAAESSAPVDGALDSVVHGASVDRVPDPEEASTPGDLASPPPFAIVATSGTTGTPKGAVLSRRAILASAEASAQNLGWERDDRWLLCMPLAHVGGLSILTRCLIARRAVVMLPRFDAALVLDAIRRHRVTLLSVVPTMLRALLDADQDGVLSRPRAILLGGASAPPALLDECASRHVRALTTYGLTEACSQVTSQSPRSARREDVPGAASGPSIHEPGCGVPLPGFDVRIAGPTSDDPLPSGEIGRILVRGPALFDGYLVAGRPTLDRGPLTSAFLDTGDLGALDEQGRLHVHVRRTDLIVTGGENVYPVEIEHAIERFPGVRRAAVFGVPDERWGQIVAAAVEADPTNPPDLKHLVDVLSTTLAPHKRPRKWAIVAQLPLTGSGKLARGQLLALHEHALLPLR